MVNQLGDFFILAFAQIKDQQERPFTDIYFQIAADGTSVLFYDEQEHVIFESECPDSLALSEDAAGVETLQGILKGVVQLPSVRKAIEEMIIQKPFSLVWVDHNFGELTELISIDDNVVVLQDDFLEYLDKELDDFLHKLLS